jgi:hypothetical protein
MPSDSPEAKYDRLKRQLQESILREYPNPERKGCPGDAVVKRLAALPPDEPIERDPNWHHLTHCAECYREFLAARAAAKEQASAQRQWMTWGLAAAAVLLLVFGFLAVRHFMRPQNAELAYRKRLVKTESMRRGGEGKESKPLILERDREELTFELPIGSKAGPYEVRIRRDDRVVLSKMADASIVDGTTAFTVGLDLSRFDPGNYSIDVRQVGFDWSYFPVEIR